MPYVPKSRIQSNLYTAGKEYVIESTLEPYIGYYYKTYTGRLFTGKNPDDKPNRTLILRPEKTQANQSQVYIKDGVENEIYKQIKGIQGNNLRNSPQLFYTQPTEDDYNLGEFQRFFCKKRSEFIYLEISQTDYNNLVQNSSTIDFQNWVPFNIPWTLTGNRNEVYDTNRSIVLLKEKNERFYGFGKYLQEDYLKYYFVAKIEENLETDGTEFQNQRTGKPYIGKYHIHPEKGPMVGAKHIEKYHDYLVPINKVVSNNEIYSPSIQINIGSSGGY
jgi:hypothetical protein